MRLIKSFLLILLPLISVAEQIQIVAVGDVLLHMPLQEKGQSEGFSTLWSSLVPLLQTADIAYANLEGPVAEMIDARGNETQNESKAYTAYPMFNYPPALIPALKEAGFDVVSTANNHALDRLAIGIDKTITALHASALLFTGTRRQNSEDEWFALTRVKGISVAWLACAYDTNGILDKHRQVLHCSRDKQRLIELVNELAKTYDAVIVTPHWGVEFQVQANASQKKLAQELANAGALAILGSHPHCMQAFTWIKSGTGKAVFVAFSLGNFVSNQGSLKNRSSGLLSLSLSKQGNGITIDKVVLYPTYMENRGGKIQLSVVTSKKHPVYQWLKTFIGENYLGFPDASSVSLKNESNKRIQEKKVHES